MTRMASAQRVACPAVIGANPATTSSTKTSSLTHGPQVTTRAPLTWLKIADLGRVVDLAQTHHTISEGDRPMIDNTVTVVGDLRTAVAAITQGTH